MKLIAFNDMDVISQLGFQLMQATVAGDNVAAMQIAKEMKALQAQMITGLDNPKDEFED